MELTKKIDELIELVKPEETELLSKLAELKADTGKVDEEFEKMGNRISDLSAKYKSAILNGTLPPNHSTEETGASQPVAKSFEECVLQVLEKRN